MTDSLTIHCANAPGDILVVDQVLDCLVVEVVLSGDKYNEHAIALNRQSAQELYDLLGEFLADDQR